MISQCRADAHANLKGRPVNAENLKCHAESSPVGSRTWSKGV